jgi:hypothetical protein
MDVPLPAGSIPAPRNFLMNGGKDMFGKNKVTSQALLYTPEQPPAVIRMPEADRFVEFEGAMAHADDDGRLEFVPRGPININVHRIGAYYDHTIILFGSKIRVMETAAQIALKIMEAER